MQHYQSGESDILHKISKRQYYVHAATSRQAARLPMLSDLGSLLVAQQYNWQDLTHCQAAVMQPMHKHFCQAYAWQLKPLCFSFGIACRSRKSGHVFLCTPLCYLCKSSEVQSAKCNRCYRRWCCPCVMTLAVCRLLSCALCADATYTFSTTFT